MEEDEKEIVQELTDHIKKIRFVVSETISSDYLVKLEEMKSFLGKEKYEPLVEVREEDTNVNIWGLFDGDKIKTLIISVLDDNEGAVLFNIKSDLDLNRLQQMNFFKDLVNKQNLHIESSGEHKL